ncbi:MAG: phage protein Gp37 [Pseudomonadota bacterium]
MTLTLPGLLAEIATQIDAGITGLRTVEPHSGRIDLEELKRIGAKAPAVYVALAGIGQLQEVDGPVYEAPLSLVAFVVTADHRGPERAEAAVALVEGLVGLVPGRRWTPACYPAGLPRADNLYGTAAGNQGLALWSVAWTQTVQLTCPEPGVPIDLTIFATGLEPGDEEVQIPEAAA